MREVASSWLVFGRGGAALVDGIAAHDVARKVAGGEALQRRTLKTTSSRIIQKRDFFVPSLVRVVVVSKRLSRWTICSYYLIVVSILLAALFQTGGIERQCMLCYNRSQWCWWMPMFCSLIINVACWIDGTELPRK